MEVDEFFVLASDGIWDCLSSQDVVDFVRYQVSKGKELTEIGGMICDHCLAPDTRDEGIGCDNMTILIVAISHGRSKKKWYAWIKDRVKKKYGYETPSTPPQLYTQSRLDAFQANKEKYKIANREREEKAAAAERNASTSVQSTPSSTQAGSRNAQNDLSEGSASEDELPGHELSEDEQPEAESKTIAGWLAMKWKGVFRRIFIFLRPLSPREFLVQLRTNLSQLFFHT